MTQTCKRDPNFVKVVRCIDCIHNTLNTDGVAESWCYKHGIDVEGDDYCSYGEKQEVDAPTNTPTDLISRQAVIEEIGRWRGYLDEDMIARIRIGIRNLPYVKTL